MWRRARLAVGLLGLAAMAWGGAHLPVPPEVGVASNALGDDLLRVFGKDARDGAGNLIFSPLSISCAFAMLDAGARGGTAAEIGKVLHFPADTALIHEGYARLADSLNVWTDTARLRLVNALCPQRGYPILPDYKELLKTRYHAVATELDFARNAAGSTKIINDWIERQTEQRIRDMIPPGSLDATTRFVLVNAIYFKCLWESQFEESATVPKPFFPLAGDAYPAKTMRQTEEFPYLENDLVQVLELPYVGGRYSMVIALPRQRLGLPEVTKQFCDSTLGVDLRNLRPTLVDVSLPKFVIEGPTVDLIPYLQRLGMEQVFDPDRADLGGVSQEKPLWVYLVLHKAWIEVDEKGTEAAAATVIAGMGGMPEPMPRPVVFRADHPFLFLIRDRGTGSALFIGQLVAPPKAK